MRFVMKAKRTEMHGEKGRLVPLEKKEKKNYLLWVLILLTVLNFGWDSYDRKEDITDMAKTIKIIKAEE